MSNDKMGETLMKVSLGVSKIDHSMLVTMFSSVLCGYALTVTGVPKGMRTGPLNILKDVLDHCPPEVSTALIEMVEREFPNAKGLGE